MEYLGHLYFNLWSRLIHDSIMNVFISINTVLLCLVSICTIVIVWRLKKRKQLYCVEESELDVKPAQDLDLVIINEASQSVKKQPTEHVTKLIEAAQPGEKETKFIENQSSMLTNNISYHVVGHNCDGEDEYINGNAFRKLPPLPGPNNTTTN